MKKIWGFIIVVGIIVICFWYFYNRHQAYELNYELSGYDILERFDVNKDHYYIRIKKEEKVYETYLTIDYSPRRKIVTSIDFFEEKNMQCIRLNDNILKYPLCKQNEEYVSYYNDQVDEGELRDTFNNIQIYNLLNNSFLVWNYTGFYYLNDDKFTTLNLFENDVYMPYLLQQINEYLFISDYDSKYEFSKYYLINIKKAKSEIVKLDKKISNDSVILGTYKNSIYLVDPKAEQEYEINIKKGKIYKTSPKILVNNEWKKTDISRLTKNLDKFEEEELFSYIVDNKKLYFIQDNIKTRITNLNVDTIIDYNESDVYFISNGTVYNFNLSKGLTKLLQYSEWNFNYTNCVFLYNNKD